MAFTPDEATIKANLTSMKADMQIGAVSLPKISAQQRYYVAARVGGMTQAEAGKQVGIAPSTASYWDNRPEIRQHIEHYMDEFSSKVLPRVKFTLEDAHQMYMNAYHSAGTSAEMTRATDSLVKLHRLHETPDEQRMLPSNSKQLENLDTQTLLRYAAIGMDTLRPGDIEDGDFEEVDELDGEA